MMPSHTLHSLRVRVGQVGYSLTARWAPTDASVLAALSPAERALFDQMRPADRTHALRVARRVRQAGYGDAALIKAALLHDVGKAGHGVHLLHRVLRVLLAVVLPWLLALIAGPDAGWHEPFHALVYHATMGADRLADVGSDPLTVALVRYHDAPAPPPDLADHADWLRALQTADDLG
ncbi:MAG: HD domain-containing protein [Anaerolineae bacterium]